MASFGGFGKNSGPTAPPRAQTPFGHFPRPNTTPFPDSSSSPSSAPLRFPSPRSFGTYERAPAPSLSPSTSALGNGSQATTPPQPFVAPSRPASMRWGDRQSPPTRDFCGPNQKRSPPFGSPDIGTATSKVSRYQDLGRSRSPVQYTDDFLAGPASDGMKGPTAMRWGDRQNPRTGDFGGPNQKRSPPSGSPDIGTTTSKVSRLQDMERSRSPVQYTDDFLAEPVSDGMEGHAPWGRSSCLIGIRCVGQRTGT